MPRDARLRSGSEALLPWPGGAEAASCWLQPGGTYYWSLTAKHEPRVVTPTLSRLVRSITDFRRTGRFRFHGSGRLLVARSAASAARSRASASSGIESSRGPDPQRCEIPHEHEPARRRASLSLFPAAGACWSRAPRPLPVDPALLLLTGRERHEGSVDVGSCSSSGASQKFRAVESSGFHACGRLLAIGPAANTG
jgi:hypothetical protein